MRNGAPSVWLHPSRTIRCSGRRAWSGDSLRCLSATRAVTNSLDRRDHYLHPIITDRFAELGSSYRTPKYPIVLAHGLLGFDEIRPLFPFPLRMQYWRGIKQALNARGIRVVTTAVPPAASIQERAAVLEREIKAKVDGSPINLVAHSMGGLDARYLISSLEPTTSLEINSLTTVATPHRGSSFADYVLEQVGQANLSNMHKLLARLGVDSGAFIQLTREYMEKNFNPANLDHPRVRYFSYGAQCNPSIWSVFRFSHGVISATEGPNDGLVSVRSSRWDENGYKGTLDQVSHLDLINWTNRLKWLAAELKLTKRGFNAIAFYLGIAGMRGLALCWDHD